MRLASKSAPTFSYLFLGIDKPFLVYCAAWPPALPRYHRYSAHWLLLLLRGYVFCPGSLILVQVTNVVTNPQNDHLPLDVASRLCNSDLLSRTEQLICFAFHDSNTIIETTREARSLNMIVTELYLD